MNAGLTFTDSVICYKELIEKEDTARRAGKQRLKEKDVKAMWRPVEPFEATGASESKTELPPSIPVSAIRNPPLYRDTVGNEGLAGGTPLRFGGEWDIVSEKVEKYVDPNKAQRTVKKGPHDCYCDIGFNAWSMAGKARTHNFGLRGVFEREFWTNSACAALAQRTQCPSSYATCLSRLCSPLPPIRSSRRARPRLGPQGRAVEVLFWGRRFFARVVCALLSEDVTVELRVFAFAITVISIT